MLQWILLQVRRTHGNELGVHVAGRGSDFEVVVLEQTTYHHVDKKIEL
jgi:hypothetical protein